MNSKSKRYWFEFVIVGDPGVGKTSLVSRFVKDRYGDRTIDYGDFRFEGWVMKVDGKTVRLNILDITGNKKMRPFIHTYFDNTDGMIVAYDCTKMESFHNVKQWIEEVDKYAPENVSKFLVATKCDLIEKKVVSYDIAKKYADHLGIPIFETSAKTSTNVDEAFARMATRIMEKVDSSLSIAPTAKRMKIEDRVFERSKPSSSTDRNKNSADEDEVTDLNDLLKKIKKAIDEGTARNEKTLAELLSRIEKLENKEKAATSTSKIISEKVVCKSFSINFQSIE